MASFPAARSHVPRKGAKRPGWSARAVLRLGLLSLPGVLAFVGCSLKDVHRDDCQSDGQCVKLFGAGSKCAEGYCTEPTTVVDPSCQQTGPDGRACNACPPKTQVDFLNACTSAACEPFDDKARLTKLTEDGGLPKLPPPPTPDAGGGDSGGGDSGGDSGDAGGQ